MVKIDFFELEPYSKYDFNHNRVIDELSIDYRASKYLGDIRFMIQMIEKRKAENHIDEMYMAIKNGEYVGFISLSVIEDRYEVSIGLLPKFRGENLAVLLTTDFVEHVFEWYPELDEVYAKIDPNNTASIKAAINSGFEQGYGGRYVMRNMNKRIKL